MFCDATAPTPARACAQRAATAGLDEETTIPSMPVSAQRALRLKVMARGYRAVTSPGRTRTRGRARPESSYGGGVVSASGGAP